MASKRDVVAVEVTRDDQYSINTFGRMHRRYEQVKDLIEKRRQDMENLNDAADEIMIADDVKMVYGECFVRADCDDADAMISGRKAEVEKELADLEAERKDLDEKMKALKGKLYAKFGTQIYLESE